LRYFVKFSVVPDSSERKKTLDRASPAASYLVERGDRRVVPHGDLAEEDVGGDVGVEDELVEPTRL
jgi:hypothetical protein